MISKLIVWIILKIYKSRIRKAIGKDNIILLKGMCATYINNLESRKKTFSRSTYVKELKKAGLCDSEYVEKIHKLMNKLSDHMSITNEVFLYYLFINGNGFANKDYKDSKNQEWLDETVSHVEYLVNLI